MFQKFGAQQLSSPLVVFTIGRFWFGTGSQESLTLGHDFNQSLRGVRLPAGLKHLTFGDTFDRSLEERYKGQCYFVVVFVRIHFQEVMTSLALTTRAA